RPQGLLVGVELGIPFGSAVGEEVFAEFGLACRLGLRFLLLLGLLLGFGLFSLLLSVVVGFGLFRFQRRDLFGRVACGFSQQDPGREANRGVLNIGPDQRTVLKAE